MVDMKQYDFTMIIHLINPLYDFPSFRQIINWNFCFFYKKRGGYSAAFRAMHTRTHLSRQSPPSFALAEAEAETVVEALSWD
jgi:hypothetical protein